jgi:hypothetical protein
MGGLVWVGFVAFFVVALVVGVRVLLLARRTRQLPELLMGIGVLGIGPVGFGLMVFARRFEDDPNLHMLTLGTALFAVSAGAFAKFVFNWRVYHPDSGFARGVALAAGAGLFGTFVWSGLAYGFVSDDPLVPVSLSRSVLQIGCLLWGAAESLNYWTRMRLRVRLGLADPVVCNRFLMWAIGAFAAGWGTAVGLVGQIITGASTAEAGWVMASSSLHGLVAAIAIALAFVPPKAYVRYIRMRAERNDAAASA